MKVLIIDNYDSFVYNLYQEIGELGADPLVYRNDGITMKDVRQLAPDAIVLSPGPGHPANARDFGVCRNILEELSPANSIPSQSSRRKGRRSSATSSRRPGDDPGCDSRPGDGRIPWLRGRAQCDGGDHGRTGDPCADRRVSHGTPDERRGTR